MEGFTTSNKMTCQGKVDVNIKLEFFGEEMTIEEDAIQFENDIHITGRCQIFMFFSYVAVLKLC